MRIGLTRQEFNDLDLGELASLFRHLEKEDKHQATRDANILFTLTQPHSKSKLSPSDFMPRPPTTEEERSKKVEGQMMALKAMAKGFNKPSEKDE